VSGLSTLSRPNQFFNASVHFLCARFHRATVRTAGPIQRSFLGVPRKRRSNLKNHNTLPTTTYCLSVCHVRGANRALQVQRAGQANRLISFAGVEHTRIRNQCRVCLHFCTARFSAVPRNRSQPLIMIKGDWITERQGIRTTCVWKTPSDMAWKYIECPDGRRYQWIASLESLRVS
jgi:hypothetical protein